MLGHPDNFSHPPQLSKLMLTAQKLGVQVVFAEAAALPGVEAAFKMFERERVRATIVFNDTYFAQQTRQIADAATKHRVATLSGITRFAEAGNLMSYGAELLDNFRRAATYVDKILKGAKPADLPVVQPSKFELALNLKTAKALGIAIPTLVATPCPSGPVVVSTPEVQRYSGCPAHLLLSWRKRLRSSSCTESSPSRSYWGFTAFTPVKCNSE